MTRGTRTAATALVALGLAGTLGSVPVAASPPGANGRITFMRIDDHGSWQTWAANPNLTAAVKLTAGAANSGWSVWSPDGARIAFDSDRTDPDLFDDSVINDVFAMDADGGALVKLTDSTGFSGDPHYSPNGRLIVFDSDRDGPLSVYVMEVDGSGARRVTTAPAGAIDSEPRFSPDGSQIVFARIRNGQVNKHGRTIGDPSALFVVNVDGSGLRRITGWGERVNQADWSPDGSRIVYEDACCYLGNADLYTVSPDGGGHAKLTHGHGITGIGNGNAFQFDGYYDPVWSPDGTRILFGREFLDEDGSFRVGLATIKPDGTDMQWVASEVRAEHQPDWGTAPLK